MGIDEAGQKDRIGDIAERFPAGIHIVQGAYLDDAIAPYAHAAPFQRGPCHGHDVSGAVDQGSFTSPWEL